MKKIILVLITLFSINAQSTQSDEKITYIFVNYTMQTIKVKPIVYEATKEDTLIREIDYWKSFQLRPGMLKKIIVNKNDLPYLTKLNNLAFSYSPKKRISVSYDQMLITFQPGF